MTTTIIAEAGVNHNGSLKLAKQMIDEAAKAGADFVAPYISHIDNIGADGVTAVEEMVMAFENGGYPCKVLGASFRTADQIRRLATVGCQAVTITPEMFDLLIAHASTDASM